MEAKTFMMSDAKLRKIKEFVYSELLVDNIYMDVDMCDGIWDALTEYQQLREQTSLLADQIKNIRSLESNLTTRKINNEL